MCDADQPTNTYSSSRDKDPGYANAEKTFYATAEETIYAGVSPRELLLRHAEEATNKANRKLSEAQSEMARAEAYRRSADRLG